MSGMKTIYKGDFAGGILTLANPDEVKILQISVQIGAICKKYEAPVFPLAINLEEDETAQLDVGKNSLFVSVWLESGKHTSIDSPTVWVRENHVQCA